MFGAVQFLNVLILTFLSVTLFHLVKVTELPPVWERAANLAIISLSVKIFMFIFPFDD